MKVAFYSKEDREDARAIIYSLALSLRRSGYDIVEEKPDIVIVIGGDGTYLKAIQHYANDLDKVSFVGIGIGELSYFYDFTGENWEDITYALTSKFLETVEYPLLECTLNKKKYYAFNDFRIINPTRVESIYISINGEGFEKIVADGVCVATPIGSTGFNKSNRGAVIHPSLDAFQLTEINSITNRNASSLGSPLVLSGRDSLIVAVDGPFKFCYDCLDIDVKDATNIEITKSKKTVKILRIKDYSFYQSLKEGFVK
ncbi:MAG: hypothetical protein LUC31_00200 [Coprobacillus sp.]|nr:hypothetical protein [Coprobacillus sp.]